MFEIHGDATSLMTFFDENVPYHKYFSKVELIRICFLYPKYIEFDHTLFPIH